MTMTTTTNANVSVSTLVCSDNPDRHAPRTHRKERTVPHRKNRRMRRLLSAYHKGRDTETRDLIYREHFHLAERYAKKYSGRGIDYEDLLQEAGLGLLKAIEGFDPARGVEFPTYAIWFVEGWIRQYFRDKAWICKVPRSVKGMSLQIKSLSCVLGRFPTREEIAEHCNIPPERIGDAIAAAQTWCSVSLHQDQVGADLDPSTARETACVDAELEALFTRLALEDAARRSLDEAESAIVRLYYFDDLSQREIAERLGTYQMMVSRSLRKSADKLNAELTREGRQVC